VGYKGPTRKTAPLKTKGAAPGYKGPTHLSHKTRKMGHPMQESGRQKTKTHTQERRVGHPKKQKQINRCVIHMDGTRSVLDNFSRYGASIRVLA